MVNEGYSDNLHLILTATSIDGILTSKIDPHAEKVKYL